MNNRNACRKIVFLLAACFITPLWAQDAAPERGKTITDTQSLEAQDGHELCFQMDAQEKLTYSFSAGAELQFNLHYHTDEQVFSPVPNHAAQAESGDFTAEIDQFYCLMWVNGSSETVELEAEYMIE